MKPTGAPDEAQTATDEELLLAAQSAAEETGEAVPEDVIAPAMNCKRCCRTGSTACRPQCRRIKPVKERLQKILARAGISSRRKAEEMILEGRVSVNGGVVLELGTKADAGQDVIELDGMAIGAAENKVYVMLNKPPGYITSVDDPEGRPTVMNIVTGIPERIVPVGRLDYETEGLLILTNDGDFSQLLQHPRFQIERCYRVKVKGMPHPQCLISSGPACISIM